MDIQHRIIASLRELVSTGTNHPYSGIPTHLIDELANGLQYSPKAREEIKNLIANILRRRIEAGHCTPWMSTLIDAIINAGVKNKAALALKTIRLAPVVPFTGAEWDVLKRPPAVNPASSQPSERYAGRLDDHCAISLGSEWIIPTSLGDRGIPGAEASVFTLPRYVDHTVSIGTYPSRLGTYEHVWDPFAGLFRSRRTPDRAWIFRCDEKRSIIPLGCGGMRVLVLTDLFRQSGHYVRHNWLEVAIERSSRLRVYDAYAGFNQKFNDVYPLEYIDHKHLFGALIGNDLNQLLGSHPFAIRVPVKLLTSKRGLPVLTYWFSHRRLARLPKVIKPVIVRQMIILDCHIHGRPVPEGLKKQYNQLQAGEIPVETDWSLPDDGWEYLRKHPIDELILVFDDAGKASHLIHPMDGQRRVRWPVHLLKLHSNPSKRKNPVPGVSSAAETKLLVRALSVAESAIELDRASQALAESLSLTPAEVTDSSVPLLRLEEILRDSSFIEQMTKIIACKTRNPDLVEILMEYMRAFADQHAMEIETLFARISEIDNDFFAQIPALFPGYEPLFIYLAESGHGKSFRSHIVESKAIWMHDPATQYRLRCWYQITAPTKIVDSLKSLELLDLMKSDKPRQRDVAACEFFRRYDNTFRSVVRRLKANPKYASLTFEFIIARLQGYLWQNIKRFHPYSDESIPALLAVVLKRSAIDNLLIEVGGAIHKPRMSYRAVGAVFAACADMNIKPTQVSLDINDPVFQAVVVRAQERLPNISVSHVWDILEGRGLHRTTSIDQPASADADPDSNLHDLLPDQAGIETNHPTINTLDGLSIVEQYLSPLGKFMLWILQGRDLVHESWPERIHDSLTEELLTRFKALGKRQLNFREAGIVFNITESRVSQIIEEETKRLARLIKSNLMVDVDPMLIKDALFK